ncbi:MAG: recombinase RecA, partial [Deltaproteobacteria bacterium]|nr:recombinase RecA [Deltaproteobacteria bacterium]
MRISVNSISTDKQVAIQQAIAQIEKQFGRGSIMKLGGQVIADVPYIPTGSLALDQAL